MVTSIYVCVISEFTLPTLEACMSLRPEHIVLIASDGEAFAKQGRHLQGLLQERLNGSRVEILSSDSTGQRQLLRGLMNVRMVKKSSAEFLNIQDAYLQEETAKKGVTDVDDLTPVQQGLYLWQGDITALRCDAIVNAANSGMTGCYVPNHRCIDNCIHTFAGVQLRLYCEEVMEAQGHAEPTGQAKITPAYNLPCRYVLHTVGPIVGGHLTETHCRQLADCYRSCLSLAAENGLKSVAFCCISTGEFHFPNEKAAEIAVATVKEFLAQKETSVEKVIFNVFKDRDREIYEELLGEK